MSVEIDPKSVQIEWIRTKWRSIERRSTIIVGECFQVERVAKKGKPVFVMFVEDANKPLNGEKSIIKITDQFDIGLVKVESPAPRFGIRKLPGKF